LAGLAYTRYLRAMWAGMLFKQSIELKVGSTQLHSRTAGCGMCSIGALPGGFIKQQRNARPQRYCISLAGAVFSYKRH